MTLSGKKDRPEPAQRPWLLRVIVTVAIVVLVGALIYALVSGFRFF